MKGKGGMERDASWWSWWQKVVCGVEFAGFKSKLIPCWQPWWKVCTCGGVIEWQNLSHSLGSIDYGQ